MITIIKPGKVKAYQYTCTKCGCVFRFEELDIVDLYPTQKGIMCPHCGILLYLSNLSALEVKDDRRSDV